MKKKILSLIAIEILNKGNFIELENLKWQLYNFILDMIVIKLYKPKKAEGQSPPKHTCTIQFDNKVLKAIRLSHIFNIPDIV